MAKIILSTPNTPYTTTIDTEVMNVELRDVFLGVSFVTDEGVRFSVSMRDDGFEIRYSGDHFETSEVEFKDGSVRKMP